MHRALRCMICLLLVCALLVNVSPIRAEASVAGTLAAAAISVTIGTLIGLGISTGADTIAHTELAYEALEAMQLAGYVTATGTVALASLGSGRYGVRSSFIQSLFDWLYDRSVISSSSFQGSTSGYFIYSGITYEFEAASAPMRVVCALSPGSTTSRPNMDIFFITQTYGATASYYTNKPVKIVCDQSCGSGYYYHRASTTASYTASQLISWTPDVYYYTTASTLEGRAADCPWWGEIGTSYDLELGYVASPGTSLATGYPAWHANSISIPNAETGEEEEYYPIAIGKTHEETQGFTQEDVWAGNGTYVDSEVVPDTGDGTITVPDNVTLKDILTGVVSIPQAISIAASNVVAAVQAIPAAIQAIPAAIADFFSVKGEVGSFTISLSDYFPFCIPFDLYDFFACLNADPVAPVIEWAIFERDGTAHPIIIDLSAYDSVAQLLRRLQLLLFCVGLAFKTRDLIKG